MLLWIIQRLFLIKLVKRQRIVVHGMWNYFTVVSKNVFLPGINVNEKGTDS